jgi:hypothetical protein
MIVVVDRIVSASLDVQKRSHLEPQDAMVFASVGQFCASKAQARSGIVPL